MNNGFPYVAQITCCVLCIQTKFDLHLDASFTYKKNIKIVGHHCLQILNTSFSKLFKKG